MFRMKFFLKLNFSLGGSANNNRIMWVAEFVFYAQTFKFVNTFGSI